mmetsp:Transcript_20579/g.57194  ORF Transcript_20579/g.57194 Transcript_20579/m.57194 type:complete len:221 (+) Transcript_20579:2698-3360(+)
MAVRRRVRRSPVCRAAPVGNLFQKAVLSLQSGEEARVRVVASVRSTRIPRATRSWRAEAAGVARVVARGGGARARAATTGKRNPRTTRDRKRERAGALHKAWPWRHSWLRKCTRRPLRRTKRPIPAGDTEVMTTTGMEAGIARLIETRVRKDTRKRREEKTDGKTMARRTRGKDRESEDQSDCHYRWARNRNIRCRGTTGLLHGRRPRGPGLAGHAPSRR